MWKTLLKYALTTVVPALVTIFGSKYLGAAGAATLGATVGGVGGRLLHTTPAP